VTRAAIFLLLLVPAAASADPRTVKAPPATTEPTLPAGITLAPVVVPKEPAFKLPPAKWWKKKNPCPKGSKRVVLKNDRADSPREWATAIVCRDAKGEVHGPSIALYKDGSPFEEDTGSINGTIHGIRRAWEPDGSLRHQTTFVMAKQHGPHTEWHDSDGHITKGDYLDDEQHGLWLDFEGGELTVRGYYDRGKRVGTWIGSEDKVATARMTLDYPDGGGMIGRMFDRQGRLVYELRWDADRSGSAAAWTIGGVLMAEYTCVKGGATHARFFDAAGKLAAQWDDAKRILTDAKGKTVDVTDERRKRLSGVRDACNGYVDHMRMHQAPSYDAALDTKTDYLP
jgi:antitoxin component YwqK of YwqJK toxin-antitoxin module